MLILWIALLIFPESYEILAASLAAYDLFPKHVALQACARGAVVPAERYG